MAIRPKVEIDAGIIRLLVADETARQAFRNLAVNHAVSTTRLVSDLRVDFKQVRKALEQLEERKVVEREMGVKGSSAAIDWWRLTPYGVQVAETLPPDLMGPQVK